MRTGGQIVVDALIAHGVDRVFCVPGESYLAILDALVDSAIDVVVARHEGGAANMAEADGKLTGRPGVCLVTRGPGATHASVGVHTAMQDSTPMLLLIGQVDREYRGREAFQEVDFSAMFSPLAKWAAEVDDTSRLPEMLARAFAVAVSGRPGPVVLSLPEDMLFGASDAADVPPMAPVARAADVDGIVDLLGSAERPLILVGGGDWNASARENLARFAAAWKLPVAGGFRRQALLANDDPRWVGHVGLSIDPALAARARDSDLILAFGGRLGETTTGYELIAAPVPTQPLIHAHPDPNELGRVCRPTLAVCAGMPTLMAALAQTSPPIQPRWTAWLCDARAGYEAFTRRALRPEPRGVDLEAVVTGLSNRLGPETIVTNGAGNYAIWVGRFWRYGAGMQLAPTSGAMGYGLPAAIAAKLRHPERTVLCFAGDGCWQMYPQEFATAVQHNAAVIVIVVDNGMFGTIRMHQERRYPGRVSATAIRNPDFSAISRAHGGFGEAVETTAAFWPAFERAHAFTVAEHLPALLHLHTDPARITPETAT